MRHWDFRRVDNLLAPERLFEGDPLAISGRINGRAANTTHSGIRRPQTRGAPFSRLLSPIPPIEGMGN
jgi:hypothetical protein